MVNSFLIETARAPLDSVYFEVLRKQPFGEVGEIRAGDACNDSSFAPCWKCGSHLVCSLERIVRPEIRARHNNSTRCACCFGHFLVRDRDRPAICKSAFTIPQMKLYGSVPQA
jgi:hypothetical protein